jgi:protein SCO1/2
VRRIASIAFLAVLCAGCGGKAATLDYRGTELSPPPAAPSFTLDDQGTSVTFRPKRDGYTVVTFLYTHCPDVCPIVAGNLNQALKTDVARRAKLRVVAVSVDPRGDTPAAVRAYIRSHRLLTTFRYLTGSRAELARVWRAYHIAALPGPKGTVAHQLFEFLIDPQGREILLYDDKLQTSDLVHDLTLLTRE